MVVILNFVDPAVPNISSSLTTSIDVTPTFMHDTNLDRLMKLTTEFKPNVSRYIKKLPYKSLLCTNYYGMILHTSDQESFWTSTIGIQDMIQLNTSVKINYTDSNTGKSCGNGTVSANSCTNGICIHEFEIDSSLCPQTDFTIKLFATNDLGDGETSDAIRRGTVFINSTLFEGVRHIHALIKI